MQRFYIRPKTKKADLYQFVFSNTGLKYVIFLMMLFFLLHPVMPAFASELVIEAEAAPVEAEASPVSEEAELTALAETPTEEVAVETLVETPTLYEVPTASQTEESSVAETSVVPTLPDGVLDVLVSVSDTEPALDVETPVESGSGSELPTAATPEVSEVAPELLVVDRETPVENETAVATSSEVGVVLSTPSHSDAAYAFSKQQCVSMGGGSYHCFDGTKDAALALRSDGEYRVFSAIDAGDLEIFEQEGSRVTQLTDNTTDDTAPFYDAVSGSVVWQRQVDDVFEIVAYEDGREAVLSESTENSMEPKRFGDFTVWQGWQGDNWDIFVHDGNAVKQITFSQEHDVAPYIQGEYVVWSISDGVTQTVALYNTTTGVLESIDDTEGARAENPRLVLVYDAKFANGDIITKGIDPETGNITALAAQSGVPLPDIPSSESTGETRALIQNKSNSREDFTEELDTSEAATTTATTTPNLNQSDTTGTSTVAVITIATNTPPVLELTDFDIIVTPFSATTTEAN